MPDSASKLTKLHCDVAIIGAGPVGLLLATELGMRGIDVVALERRPGPTTHPAAHHHAARSMEHCRRLGLAQAIREAGLPRDFRPDVTYWTRLGGHELARLSIPSSLEVSAAARLQEDLWPTPELPHRCAQSFFEPILASAARRQKTVRLYYGWSVARVADRGEEAWFRAEARDGEGEIEVRAKYLIGCDGPKSLVREAIGAQFSGTRSERIFFGGQMLSINFSCPGLYDFSAAPPAWHYWMFNKDFRALIVSVDGRGNFVMNLQPPVNDNPQGAARAATSRFVGNLPCSIHSVLPWTAGHALVADRYRGGRLLIAGDAAHLFTPTGGLGYNTGVGDAANLAWKLAAVCRGWAPDALLDSYGIERRPIAIRNTGFSRATADRLERFAVADALEENSPAGEAERRRFGAILAEHGRLEFVAPGCHLGEGYPDSPIVVADGSTVEDKPERYTPAATPGMRAPHAWCHDGSSLFDHFGFGFALLALRRTPVEAKPIVDAAAARQLPLHVIARQESEIRDLYQADFVLVRPDHHVAWRGNKMPDDPDALLVEVTGAVS